MPCVNSSAPSVRKHEGGVRRVAHYSFSGNIPSLTLKYIESRGYHLVIPAAELELLPDDGTCCQVVQHKKTAKFSTEELMSLNARNRVRVLSSCDLVTTPRVATFVLTPPSCRKLVRKCIV